MSDHDENLSEEPKPDEEPVKAEDEETTEEAIRKLFPSKAIDILRSSTGLPPTT